MAASLILFFKSDLSALYSVFKTNPPVLTLSLTTSLFAQFLSLLKSAGTAFNCSTCILSIPAFRVAKSDSPANLDVSTPLACFFCYIIR